MKISTIVGLGAAAAVIYALYKSSEVSASSNYSIPLTTFDSSTGQLAQATVDNLPSAVEALNKAVVGKKTVVSPSQTISRGVTATIKKTGKTMTGNTAILGGQKNASFIGVTQPERNSSGLTATDVRILKNKGLEATTSNAKSQGLL